MVGRDSRRGRAWRLRTRRRLYRKQRHCHWCGEPFDEPARWEGSDPVWVNEQNFPTIDHKKPLEAGGSNARGNLVLACRPCNEARNGEGPPDALLGPPDPERLERDQERFEELVDKSQ